MKSKLSSKHQVLESQINSGAHFITEKSKNLSESRSSLKTKQTVDFDVRMQPHIFESQFDRGEVSMQSDMRRFPNNTDGALGSIDKSVDSDSLVCVYGKNRRNERAESLVGSQDNSEGVKSGHEPGKLSVKSRLKNEIKVI